MINDLIQRIANAIIRQEGMPADHTNPGNLRGAPWLKGTEYGVILPMMGGFWAPVTRYQGEAGLAHLVALHVGEGNTLTDFIAGHPGVYGGFAPGADKNDPVKYIADVKLWAAIPDEGVPLWTYISTSPAAAPPHT